ncbi:MAG: putative ATP-dependent helicase DinG [Nitrospira sp.]|nr:putative ATP-dependent helicase DinG [Nitrospira sp.]
MLHTLLRLTRPLVILDAETTGFSPDKDRIIQIGFTYFYPEKDPVHIATLLNPERAITNSGSSHHITDADVADAPKFAEIAPQIAERLVDVDLGGHNVDFDIRFIRAEMLRAGVPWGWEGHVVDTLAICRLKIPHTLENAYKFFVDEKGFAGAHDASRDVHATAEVLAGQLRHFQDLPRTVEELATFCLNKNPNSIDKTGKFVWIEDEPCINFGKHKGTSLRTMNKGYLVWMINSANFPDDAILIAGDALKGKYPTR